MTDADGGRGLSKTARLGRRPPNLAHRYAEALIQRRRERGRGRSRSRRARRDRDAMSLKPYPAVRRVAGVAPGVVRRTKTSILTEVFGKSRLEPASCGSCGSSIATSGWDCSWSWSARLAAIWDERNQRIPGPRSLGRRRSMKTSCKHLRDRLAALTGATPILLVSTDPDLIGGLVVQVGDHRYDASVKSRLAQLRQRLIEGKMHEIQSRRDQFSYST